MNNNDGRGRNNRGNYGRSEYHGNGGRSEYHGNGNDYGNRPPRTERAREPHREREQYPIPTSPPYTAIISNLPFKITEDELYDYFKELGVSKITLVTDKITKKFCWSGFYRI